MAESRKVAVELGSSYRHYTGVMAVVAKGVCIFIPLFSIFYVFRVAEMYLNFPFYMGSFTAILIMLVLIMVFLLVPATKSAPRNRLPWYDALLILASVVPTMYYAYVAEEVASGMMLGSTAFEQALFVILLIVILEAVRRSVGWMMVGIFVVFLLYIKFAYILPGLWGSKDFNLGNMTDYMYLNTFGIFGFIGRLPGEIIIHFVLFGVLLMKAGGGAFFTGAALSLAGRFRGGTAKVAVFSSAAMGTVSGSVSANAGTMGPITIPLMKQAGYKAHIAAAIESVASTGGPITPPVMASVAFIIAEATGAGYAAVVAASILPAVIYYWAVYWQIDFLSARMGMAGLPREQVPPFSKTLARFGHLGIPIVLLVVLLVLLQTDPVEAVLFSSVAVIAVSWRRRAQGITFEKLLDCLGEAARALIVIAPMLAGAGIIFGSMTMTGLGVNIGILIKDLAGGKLWLLAILTWLGIYLSGLAAGELVLYIVFSIVVGPAFVALGVPALLAHLFIFWVCVASFITPPNAPPVFITMAIAGSGMWSTGFQAMRFGIVCFLMPFIILINPVLLLRGSIIEIVIALVVSMIGIVFLAGGLEGYLLQKAGWWQRILLAIGGAFMVFPHLVPDLIGAGCALIAAIPQFRAWRLSKARAVAAVLATDGGSTKT